MAIHEPKETFLICCEQMLMALGDTIHLDSIQWPHLESPIVGPSLKHCPWCGAEMPFHSEVEE